MLETILVVCGYLVGSVSCAILVCRFIGAPDPRGVGSRNPGATNVLRVAGRNAAAITLIGDSVKGLLPVLLARGLHADPAVLALTGTAAFLGHLFPVYFRFEGGKGVATLIGVLLAMAWPLGLGFIAIWLAMARVFRISSLAALTAAALTPIIALVCGYPAPYLAATVFMSVLLIWRHRGNIRKLLEGTEGRFSPR